LGLEADSSSAASILLTLLKTLYPYNTLTGGGGGGYD
jgi:hypothetical protein